jgi:hypothetical protein
VQMIQSLNGGENVYMIEHQAYTKMVTESGENAYYTGTLADFSADSWASYTKHSGYLLARPICTACESGKFKSTAGIEACAACASNIAGCGGGSAGFRWFLGAFGASCDATCASNGGTCDASALKVHDLVEVNNIIAQVAPSMCSCVVQACVSSVELWGFYYGGGAGCPGCSDHTQGCVYSNPSYANPTCAAAHLELRRFCPCT